MKGFHETAADRVAFEGIAGSSMSFNALDVFILIVLLMGLSRGWFTGATRQVIGFAGTILAIVLALESMRTFGRVIGGVIPMGDAIEPIAGFAVVFIMVQVVLILLTKLIDAALKVLKLGLVNRFAGAVVGACKVMLILSALFLVMGSFGIPDRRYCEESTLYAPVAKVLPVTWDYVAKRLPMVRSLSDRFGQGVDHILGNEVP